jgi:BtpA family
MEKYVVFEKRLHAVIHCINPRIQNGTEHALDNAKIAFDNGADGIFLIGHGLKHQDLTHIYNRVRTTHPKAWIGMNFLDLTTKKIEKARLLSAIRQCVDISAVWMDALPKEDLGIPLWIEIFGGVAFKYLNANADGQALKQECERAILFTTCATTSGDGTGIAVGIEKLKKIHKHLSGKVPLAVASGVNKSNAKSMKPYVDVFMVASSITARDEKRENREYLIGEEVKTLAEIIHQK